MQALGVLLNVKFGGGSSGEEDTVMKEADDSNAEMRKEPEVVKKDEPEMVVEPMEELSEEEREKREKRERKEKALKEKEQGNSAYKKKDFD